MPRMSLARISGRVPKPTFRQLPRKPPFFSFSYYLPTFTFTVKTVFFYDNRSRAWFAGSGNEQGNPPSMLPCHALIPRGVKLSAARHGSLTINSPWRHWFPVQYATPIAGRGIRPFFSLRPFFSFLGIPRTRRTRSAKAKKTTKSNKVVATPVKKPRTTQPRATATRIKRAKATHYDLASWRVWAEQHGLDKRSTTYIGTDFEYTAKDRLSAYGFDLQKIGRAGDRGIDLLGQWMLPSAPGKLKVVVQCKARKIGPIDAREFEGAAHNAPAKHRGPRSTIALLIFSGEASPGAIEQIQRSQMPMAFMSMSREGILQQFIYNQAVDELCMGGLSTVEVILPVAKHQTTPKSRFKVERAIVLGWEGKPWPGIPDHYVRGSSLDSTTIPEPLSV